MVYAVILRKRSHILTICHQVRRLHLSSKEIRSTFLEFFIQDKGHKFVRSSSVIPFHDATVPFVNAGMNQFKNILLGRTIAPYAKVANSQKCIRAGGKHNDLEVVGTDGSHHTFFEMLGNWSFGDYYKEEACEMALRLLTKGFGLDRRRLRMSYFGGDENLAADEECRDVWRRLGVDDNTVFATGAAENFWEMGKTGPCGPCTEIHHINPDGSMTEIWNIVFITHNRDENGNLNRLPKHSVDTGMGLERLTALLQNKSSNYDTDLFQPIIAAIHKNSGNGIPEYSGRFGEGVSLDNAYRTLADFSRMVSVCLADGMFPGANLRLRYVLRKAFALSMDVFKAPTGLMLELHNRIAETLGETYPELPEKTKQVTEILKHEEESYLRIRKQTMKNWNALIHQYPEIKSFKDTDLPGLYEGYRFFKREMADSTKHTIPGEVTFRLYDAHGLKRDDIETIGTINNLEIDWQGFDECMHKHKSRHRASFNETNDVAMDDKINDHVTLLMNSNVTATDDSFKYDALTDYLMLDSCIVSILNSDGDAVSSVDVTNRAHHIIICDKTNFFCEEGGQNDDNGVLRINDAKFYVENTKKLSGYVLHSGRFKNDKSIIVSVGDRCSMQIARERRQALMLHHTATHLLNAAVRKVLKDSVICQISSKVTVDDLSLSLAVYGEKLKPKTIKQIETVVKEACGSAHPVATRLMNASELSEYDDVTTVPGEIYPEHNLRLVEIATPSFVSRELCCGTHAPSTSYIGEFCIIGVKSATTHTPTFKARAGHAASRIHLLAERTNCLLLNLKENSLTISAARAEARHLRKVLDDVTQDDKYPHGQREDIIRTLDTADKNIVRLVNANGDINERTRKSDWSHT